MSKWHHYMFSCAPYEGLWKHFHQENCRTFCSVLLSITLSSGLLSGIISALLSALRRMSGLLLLTACRPAWVMFLQKSTFTSSRLSPWATTPSRLQSVMRTQFSRWRQHSFLQLRSVEVTSWSVMCPQPDRVKESRLGHLWHRYQSVISFTTRALWTRDNETMRPVVSALLITPGHNVHQETSVCLDKD